MVMMSEQVHYPIVRCVVMGSDFTESFDDVRDAVMSTVKNIQSFYEERIHVQFVFPCDYTREGWSPLRGVARSVAQLTNSWVDQWFDSNAMYAPIIHPLYTLVSDRAVSGMLSESQLSPSKLDKNEIDSLFRLETSFGIRPVSEYSQWARTVFYPDMWDMFANMSHESEKFQAAPEYALTVHVNGIDDRTLVLEDEAVKAGAHVYSYSRAGGSTRQRLI
jgi:hypothetical protein